MTAEDETVFWKRPRGSELLRSYSDESLCREVVQGNHEAFLVLFDRYRQDVLRLAMSILRDRAEAEELVQSLFLEVHTTLLRYDEQRGSFRRVLLRYAYTRSIDHRRHLESRRFYTNVTIEELDPSSFVQEISLASGLSAEESTRLIEQGLEQLDEKQKSAVTAYFFRGLSVSEIAAELGDSVGNARHHLYRGIERMRKIFAPKEPSKEPPGQPSKKGENATIRFTRQATKGVAPEVSGV
jgi:RNA polymerase sigma-70 factor (ECF subfamily)